MTGKAKEKERAKRMADFAGTSTVYEGEVVPLANIEDKEVMVLDYNYAPSAFKEGNFLSMQVEIDGEKAVVNTTAKVLLKGVQNVPKDQLPLPVTFFMDKPKQGGKPYWNMR